MWDLTSHAIPTHPTGEFMELRDYQKDLYEKTRASFRSGHRRPLVVAPCGAGKSYLFSEMIRNTNGDALVLVHRQELKEQHNRLFASLGIKNARVETYQTERNRLGQYPAPRLLVVDEAHLSRSKTWAEIIKYYNTFTVGVTATPVRLDGKPLGDIFDDMVQGITVKELIKRKCLAPYLYYAPTAVETENLKIHAGDFLIKDLEQIMCNRAIYSDVLRSWERLSEKCKTIAYCVSVAHAEETAKMFRSAGYPSEVIDSDTPRHKRTQILQDFRDGKIQVICNVGIISEGVSIDDVGCCLLLRPTQSHALYWQQAMRCMRYLPGKVAKIIDCVGNYTRNPMPDSDVEWSLTQPTKKPQRINTDGNFYIRTCPNCFKVFKTAPICPHCNEPYPLHPKEIDAKREIELAMISDAEKKALEELNKRRRMEVGKCRTFEELIDIQKERGYAKGWAFRMARLKNIPIGR
jgi:superfamily II DNA or RNA helicase